MIIDPYQTCMLSNFSIKEIVKEITASFIRGEIGNYGANKNILFVTDANKNVPKFKHPILFERGDKKVVIDVRPFSKLDREDNLVIVAKEDMEVHVLQAQLTMNASLHHSYGDFSSIKGVTMKLFANWVSRKVSRTLSLDHQAQIRLTILTAYYYFSLFREGKFDQDLLEREAIIIYRQLRIPADEVIAFMQDLPEFSNLQEYTKVVKEYGGSVRFTDFTMSFLENLLANSWFGYESKESVALALEHPPTFIAMVYKASTERSYHKTEIGKLVEEINKGDTSIVSVVNGIVGKR